MDLFSFINKTSYTFEGKKEGEEVLLFLHRHWFTVVSKITYILLGGLLPLVFLVIFGQLIIEHSLMSIFVLLTFCYYMFLWYTLFYILTMYTLETWIVTNTRIINNVQCGFFDRRVSELNLHNIQDISIRMEGAISTMMSFGDIEVQTAAAEHRFLFHEVPKPQELKDVIMRQVSLVKYEQKDL